MNLFNKSETKTHLPVNHGNVLFPPTESDGQNANGASGATLRDGKITFSSPPGPASPSPEEKTQVQR